MDGERGRRRRKGGSDYSSTIGAFTSGFQERFADVHGSISQFPQFDLTKEDMDAFYDWFYGPKVAGRRPSPSDQTLLYAERKMGETKRKGQIQG